MSDIEDRLRGYRPAAPPAELRVRVLAAAGTTGPQLARDSLQWWRWLPAAAAAVVTIIFYALSGDTWAHMQQRFLTDDERRSAVNAIAEKLGDDVRARAEAERLVTLSELAQRAEAGRDATSSAERAAHD